jgi:hypothetical protein
VNRTSLIAGLAFSAALAAHAQNIEGDWQGTLNAGPAVLPLVLHFTADGHGGFRGTFDSPTQGAMGIPIGSVSLKAAKLNWTIGSIAASYEGKVSADGNQIRGTFVQGGGAFPLDFKRVGAPAAAPPAKPSDIDGAWTGTIDPGGAKLPAVVHIANTAGGLTATVDSPSQGAFGIPVNSVSRDGATLKLDVKAVGASFEGKINPGRDAIDGAWTQSGASVPLALKREMAKPSDIDGTWLGTLEFSGMKLRVVVHIANTADGLTATMDSPDQGAAGIAASVTRDGAAFKLEVKAVGAVFEGKINQGLDAIDGTFTQNGASLPLALKRVKEGAIAEPARPQNPVKPYPYREEDVTYDNPAAGIKLAATFTIPPGKGPFPAVLLICGSGAHDRDETVFGHKPFLVLADYLTRKGIAVLRADKRGVGKSGGSLATATSADFATDAEAGVAWLKTRPEVDPHNIGLIGHSEGGAIAPMVAARNRDVAFIVLLAGPGVRGDEILPAQVMAGNEAAGMSHEEAVKSGDQERAALKAIESETNPAKLREKLAAIMPKEELEQQWKTLTSPWFRYFLEYDPAAELRKVTCAVLALNGGKDTQVPSKQNIPAIRAALEAGGNKRFETMLFPGLNHLFQTAKTGGVGEYAQIEETMATAVLINVADWILRHP